VPATALEVPRFALALAYRSLFVSYNPVRLLSPALLSHGVFSDALVEPRGAPVR